ncbi:MAG: replicative DNA helicase [Eubacteriales bacterium]
MEEISFKNILPHSIDAEKSVIGSMIMERSVIENAMEILVEEDFYGKQYGTLFQCIVELFQRGTPVDLITLQEILREKNIPEEVGGIEVVKEIMATLPTSANSKYYITIVLEKSTLRKLIRANNEIATKCYQSNEMLEDILEEAEKKIFHITQKRSAGDFVPISRIVLNVMERIEEVSKNKGSITGIPTGFIDLDHKTSGLQPSDLVLIAARPSMGKTAFVLNIAQYAVSKKQECVAIFSLEMSKEQLVQRLLSLESRVNSQHMRTGELTETEWEYLVESGGIMAKSQLIIDDTPSITVAELRSKCRKFKVDHNLSMIIIDYLQLMTGKGESKQLEVSEISRGLKAVARELHVPVVALSQLSRAVEQRTSRKPMLSDLRDSGAIEQDADVVMFIYREDYYEPDTEKKGIAEIIIAKQRNGPIGSVELAWLPDTTRFANIEK